MSRFIRLAVVLGLLATMMGAGHAAIYYVSPTGNDANPGTAAQPFLTVPHGVSQLVAPGDALRIGAGTYVGPATMTMTVDGSAALPIVIEASDTERPVLQAMYFITTGSWLTFQDLIFDGSGGEYCLDLMRPGTNLRVDGCDFLRVWDDPTFNSVNTDNSGDDGVDDAPIRIWGAAQVTINNCDFFATTEPGENYAIMVINASGNTIDATGMDTSVYSGLTVTNSNNWGKNQFIGVRRPMEDILVNNCESRGSGQFFYARQANRIGSRIRQNLSGDGANPAYPSTTMRNVVINSCSATCSRFFHIDDASGATNGAAGNYTLQNSTITVTNLGSAGESLIWLDHDTIAGVVPSMDGWMGHYENVVIQNLVVDDPPGGTNITYGIHFAGSSNAAGYVKNALINNVSMEVQSIGIRWGQGFGGENILITNNKIKTRASDGIQTNFHTTFSGSRITDCTVTNNDFNVWRIGLYLFGGNTAAVPSGFQNFWLTNNTLFCNAHSGLLIANGNGAHAVMRNMTVAGNVIDSSDADGSGYPLWLFATHTTAGNESRDWRIVGNTARNLTSNGWGTLRTDGPGGVAGVFEIMNNNFTCGWFGAVLVGGTGAGLGMNNLTVTGNTFQ